MALLWVVLLWLAANCALLALAYRRALAIAWFEPTLRAPVLILESDDWGYGPPEQATRLNRVAELLSGFRDQCGRSPVMTLGVVLAGPDTERMRAEGYRAYHRVTLADARFTPVREAMVWGAARGVFALQLHGMEHYWPPCLMQASQANGLTRDWLTGSAFPLTEALPPHLQSRWIDAAALPSRPLPNDQVFAAAVEEVQLFSTLFGTPPQVAVPPTFVWTTEVESAWARAGVRVVVTPGKRYESRDERNQLVPSDVALYNGASGSDGLSYVVRDAYFEPSFGHTHERAMQALKHNAFLGRPALLEIHRVNFIGGDRQAQGTCDEISRLLQTACTHFPDIRFMNTAELAHLYRDRSELVERSARLRVHFTLRRLAQISRLRKLAWASGAILLAWLVYMFTWPRAQRRSQR